MKKSFIIVTVGTNTPHYFKNSHSSNVLRNWVTDIDEADRYNSTEEAEKDMEAGVVESLNLLTIVPIYRTL